MKQRMCMGWVGIFLFLIILALPVNPFAQDEFATLDREYEPVVVKAFNVPDINNVPVNQIFMYAFDATSHSWHMIPFQIDEKTFGPSDSLNQTKTRWHYFIPKWWANVESLPNQHDGIFKNHDELVFMVRDLGDRAPDLSYIDNVEALNYPRVELVVQDPNNPDQKAFGYLFRSSTIVETPPTPYGLVYVSEEDSIVTNYYGLGMNENGTVDGIVIKEPGGNGQDILDLLKVRFGGVIDLAFPIPMTASEEILHLFEEIQTTANPVVRIVRSAKMTLQLGDFVAEEVTFPVEASFYPFSGTIVGGTSLAPEDLLVYYGGEPILIILNNLRESWDFSSAAVGMKFYNKYNNGIIIDGSPDEVSKTVDIPINAWDLTTGDQGSLFKIGKFTEQKWGSVELYYHDDQNGGQADSDIFGDSDTGDLKSFGDNGILFRNKPGQDSITIDLNYTAFFIPEKNLTKADGEELAYNANNPVEITESSVVSDVETLESRTPSGFVLDQNYPNPFNSSTVISFNLAQKEKIRLQIFDSNGRLVKTLADEELDQGQHEKRWDGTDSQSLQSPSGIYLYKIQTSSFSQTKKLVLIK